MIFRNVHSTPEGYGIRVTSNGGGYDVKEAPYPDQGELTILRAEYRVAKNRVVVTALNSAPEGSSTLDAMIIFNDGTKRFWREMNFLPAPKGYYKKAFTNIAPKVPVEVRIRSSMGAEVSGTVIVP